MSEALKRAAQAVVVNWAHPGELAAAVRTLALVLQDDTPPKPAPDLLDTPVCPYCGSDSVTQDATAAYNPDSGKWELVDICDTVWCNTCGRDTSRGTIPRREYEAAHR